MIILPVIPQLVSPDELSVIQLNSGLAFQGFDCQDLDLIDFIKNEALTYQEKALVTTYVCLFRSSPIAFFSVCMDAIRLDPSERANSFGIDKPHKDYPAVKIARLAVVPKFQRRGVGTFLIQMVIGKAVGMSKEVACRFVSVDAYSKSVGFYLRNGFERNIADSSGHNTSLRFDLFPFIASSNK